jgi:hypothetical protein
MWGFFNNWFRLWLSGLWFWLFEWLWKYNLWLLDCFENLDKVCVWMRCNQSRHSFPLCVRSGIPEVICLPVLASKRGCFLIISLDVLREVRAKSVLILVFGRQTCLLSTDWYDITHHWTQAHLILRPLYFLMILDWAALGFVWAILCADFFIHLEGSG